jgi:hypothetical protein
MVAGCSPDLIVQFVEQPFDALWCVFRTQLGILLSALLFFGGLAVANYSYYDSVAPLIVIMMLIGSIIVTQLPPGIVQFVGIVLVIGIPAALWYVAKNLGGP